MPSGPEASISGTSDSGGKGVSLSAGQTASTHARGLHLKANDFVAGTATLPLRGATERRAVGGFDPKASAAYLELAGGRTATPATLPESHGTVLSSLVERHRRHFDTSGRLFQPT